MSEKNNCLEIIKDVATIKAFPVGTLSFAAPMNLRRRVIDYSFITGDISSGKVPMRGGSAVVEEKSQKSVAGNYYNVLIQWEVDNILGDNSAKLDILQSTAHDFVIQSASGRQMLVRSEPDAYLFSIETDGSTAKIEISVDAFSGIQQIG